MLGMGIARVVDPPWNIESYTLFILFYLAWVALKFDSTDLSPFAYFMRASMSFLFWFSTEFSSEMSSSFCFLSRLISFCMVRFLLSTMYSPFSSLIRFCNSACSLTSYSRRVKFRDCSDKDLKSSICSLYVFIMKSPTSGRMSWHRFMALVWTISNISYLAIDSITCYKEVGGASSFERVIRSRYSFETEPISSLNFCIVNLSCLSSKYFYSSCIKLW